MENVEGFAKVWDHNGIKIILDNTAKTFALNFANIVLKNYVIDLARQAFAAKQALAAAQQAQVQPPAQPPAQVPQTSLIVTTD